MNPESRQVIHVGLNYVLTPSPGLELEARLGFQRSLAEQGLTPERHLMQRDGKDMVIWCKSPTSLEIKVGGISDAPIGQLLMLATQPGVFELAQRQIEAATTAFERNWQGQTRQILRCDATLRALFETSKEHAFAEIWETRLGKNPEALGPLGRPVLGGGLRFVMPPTASSEPVIEVKIESFLNDTSKIFTETQLIWQDPDACGREFEPVARLKAVDAYVKKNIVQFMAGGMA